MRRTPYEAGGFAFETAEMMEKARKELEGARYIKNSADMSNPQMVYEVYCQMIRQGLFETPVGYAFLYELQEYLRVNPSTNAQDIPAIPVFARRTDAGAAAARAALKNAPVKTKTKVIRKVIEKNRDYKIWFRMSLTASVILLFIVIGMFAVTATSGNVNIVNYENALIEKYENWESQLKEKEDSLRERESALRRAEDAAGTEAF